MLLLLIFWITMLQTVMAGLDLNHNVQKRYTHRCLQTRPHISHIRLSLCRNQLEFFHNGTGKPFIEGRTNESEEFAALKDRCEECILRVGPALKIRTVFKKFNESILHIRLTWWQWHCRTPTVYTGDIRKHPNGTIVVHLVGPDGRDVSVETDPCNGTNGTAIENGSAAAHPKLFSLFAVLSLVLLGTLFT